MRMYWFLLVLLLGCAPRLQAFDERSPQADNWGPNPTPVEWWYVSSYLPDQGLAFHWAMFKGYPDTGNFLSSLLFPGPFHASHLAITDLNKNSKTFEERSDFALDKPRGDGITAFPPLQLSQGDWKLLQQGQTFHLEAGPLSLSLTPIKPAVVHPPGYSGTPEVGRMYYVSYTRLKLEGTVAGRKVQGEAWMDHQWGDQQSGASALWDWFGLQLSDDSDVMLYRVKDPKGAVVQLVGSLIRPDGKIESLRNLEMTPLQSWPSPAGYSYSVAWRIASEQFSTTLQPLRLDQELLTRSTHVAYWEGPVAGKGSLGGKAVDVKGMGEFVGGVYNP